MDKIKSPAVKIDLKGYDKIRSENISLDKDMFTLGVWMLKRKMFDQKNGLFKYWVAICLTILGLQIYYLIRMFKDVVFDRFLTGYNIAGREDIL